MIERENAKDHHAQFQSAPRAPLEEEDHHHDSSSSMLGPAMGTTRTENRRDRSAVTGRPG